MAVKVTRIVANIEGDDMALAQAFYRDLFALELLMDFTWINTFGTTEQMPVQLSVAAEGGSGTAVPRLSIEVEDLQTALDRAIELGIAIEYGPVTEPWGVRRFYLRDPFGTIINVLEHRT